MNDSTDRIILLKKKTVSENDVVKHFLRDFRRKYMEFLKQNSCYTVEDHSSNFQLWGNPRLL